MFTMTSYFYRTGGKFDRLTKSKVTETIVSHLDEAGVELLVGQLQAMFCDPTSTVTSEDRSGIITGISPLRL